MQKSRFAGSLTGLPAELLPARIILLAGVILLLSHSLYGQKADTTLSLQLRNATLEEFVRQVEAATGFSFVYSEEVKLHQLITLNVVEQPVHKVLDSAFANQPVTYQITGKHILLKKKQEKPVSRKFTISGYVTDGMSSETLIGANIFESRQQQGTASNPYGFYSLTLPEGEASLAFSYLGYDTRKLNFALVQDTVLNIRLMTNNLLQEIVVVSDKVEAGIRATQMSALDIPMAQVKHTPSILGEADVMKTIQLMPGVQSGMEGSAGLYVRGGGPDQNLILLDGIPVYNVDHMFGFFSVFTPEAVKKVTLFKGSFPARFGGRLSSVVDIRTNDGDMKKYHGTISVGLLTSKLHFEGPIVKDRTSFNISARRSYIDLLARPFMGDPVIGYFFYDVNAKINHKFSDRSRLFLSYYTGKDKYHFKSVTEEGWGDDYSYDRNKGDMSWGNSIVSARWNYIFNNKLFSNTTLAYNKYQMRSTNESHSLRQKSSKTLFETQYSGDYRSGINDWNWQTDFDYTPTPRHHVKFGAGYVYHTFKPEVSSSRVIAKAEDMSEPEKISSAIDNEPIRGHEITAYAEDNFELNPRLHLNAGLHLSLFKVQKKSYYSAQPRLSLRYQLHDDIALKASYTKMSQYVQLLSSTPFLALPTDLWVPVTGDIRPMQSHQFSLGAYYTGIREWEFSVEGYYKHMKNVLEYQDGVTFLGSSSSWEQKVEMGKGRSAGIEFLAQKTAGKTTGWIAYTLAKSDRTFPNGSINNGKTFPYKYDRRHNINIVLNHKFSDRINIGASWVFSTGGTITVPTEVTELVRPDGQSGTSYGGYAGYGNTNEAYYIESRNNFRLPSSHRLNIGVNFNKKTKHGVRTWNISLYNVYMASNPNIVYYNPAKYYYENEMGPDGNRTSVKKFHKPYLTKLTIFPFIPSVSYTYRF